MDSKLAAILMRAQDKERRSQEPTKLQRKAALRANDLVSRMDVPRNVRFKQQMMEIPGEVLGGRVTGKYAVPGHLPGMERLIDALALAETTMQRNRGEQEQPPMLRALHFGQYPR